ncbi:hypothetical protein AA984_11515 [Brevibacillus formosus]|uniref:Uncharacterized protein n=1 Tax=Brevibacillus formosus TaxID=54913 RepID=A0A837KNF2_9BACL|nr:hypothetical protein AA984_11515 [Brevibacillus formosus]PSJ98167.1 hypothetical protein C7R91_07965 [Brevibacillus formosus]
MAPTEGMCSLVTLNGTVRALRKLKGNVNYRKRCGLQFDRTLVEERKKEKPLRLLVTPAGGLTGLVPKTLRRFLLFPLYSYWFFIKLIKIKTPRTIQS